MIEIRPDLAALFPERNVAAFFAISGETVKHVVTERRILRFTRGGRSFYMKLHFGVGWREILKNLSQGKWPVLGAINERRAIAALEHLGITTMRVAAFGQEGWNPARRRSFLVTDAIEHTEHLQDFLPRLLAAPHTAETRRLRLALIRKVAETAHTLHTQGLNHRDFYLCHLRLDLGSADPWPDPARLTLYVMDLHRMQQRRRAPARWVAKDLAALLYSTLRACENAPLSHADMFRFLTVYCGQPARRALRQRPRFWADVLGRTRALCRKGPAPRRLPMGLLGRLLAS